MSIGSYCQFVALLKRGMGLFGLILGCLWGCGAPDADLSVSTLRSQTGTFPYASVPSRALKDVNPSSPLFETRVEADDFQGQVTAWYFSHATCSYCRSQYVLLDQMQAELQMANLELPVQIIAINGADFEAGVSAMSDEGNLPLLQDTENIDLWGLWDITYRDVVVVDATLVPIARLNLTTHDLATTTTYDASGLLEQGAFTTNDVTRAEQLLGVAIVAATPPRRRLLLPEDSSSSGRPPPRGGSTRPSSAATAARIDAESPPRSGARSDRVDAIEPSSASPNGEARRWLRRETENARVQGENFERARVY